MVHVTFAGKIVFVGFGSIGQGVLPLILRHIGTSHERITIVTAEDKGRSEAEQFGVKFVKTALTRDNYRQVLEPLLAKGDFLLNLSVDVSSVALVNWRANAARCISIPASSRGPAATPMRMPAWIRAATTPCASRRLALARGGQERADGGAHAWRQSRAWCRTWSSRPCSTSPRTPASTRARPPAARPGRSSRRRSASRSCTSPNATRR